LDPTTGIARRIDPTTLLEFAELGVEARVCDRR
jgi:hypothetical protein